MCHVSKRPLRINASITTAKAAMMNSTVAKIRWRGTRSAIAPAKRAIIFRDIRAAEIAPTKKGESVRVRIYHPRTTISIWLPMVTKVLEAQTKEKSRYRKTERG